MLIGTGFGASIVLGLLVEGSARMVRDWQQIGVRVLGSLDGRERVSWRSRCGSRNRTALFRRHPLGLLVRRALDRGGEIFGRLRA